MRDLLALLRGRGHGRLSHGFSLLSSAPLEQQYSNQGGLQSEDKAGGDDKNTMLLPECGLSKRENGLARKALGRKAPPFELPGIDLELVNRLGLRAERGGSLARQNVDREIRRRDAVRLEAVHVAAHDAAT